MKKWMKHSWLACLLLGGLVFFSWQWWSKPLPELFIQTDALSAQVSNWQQLTGREPGPEDLGRIKIEIAREAVLVEKALAAGMQNAQVIQKRLASLAGFLALLDDTDAPEATQIEAAISAGLLRSDPLVRRYLAEAMRMRLKLDIDIVTPTIAAQQQWYEAHLQNFTLPRRIQLNHVYFSHEDKPRALEVSKHLQTSATPLEEALLMGDVFYGGQKLPMKTQQQLESALGTEFAQASWGLPLEQWSAPVRSAYGWHVVWVIDEVKARQQPLEDVAAVIIRELEEQTMKAALQAKIDQLVTQYDIVWPVGQINL
ncbi:MAG: peptidyl-prolyl cis-trans isomerase [Pseudomonadales bacterium]